MVDKKQQKEEQLSVNFRVPPKTPSVTAQQLFAQNLGDFIQLSFFEMVFPLIPQDASPEQMAAIKAVGVTAECVSRVNIPASLYPDFLRVMESVANLKPIKPVKK